MREILFRGKKEGSEEWIFGSLITTCLDGHLTDYIVNQPLNYDEELFETMQDMLERRSVSHKSVGQFIGLLDKNGVKIFKGDKIKIPVYDKKGTIFEEYKVIFKDGCFVIETDSQIIPVKFLDSKEVIGNVFDNPELVKVE